MADRYLQNYELVYSPNDISSRNRNSLRGSIRDSNMWSREFRLGIPKVIVEDEDEVCRAFCIKRWMYFGVCMLFMCCLMRYIFRRVLGTPVNCSFNVSM